MTKIQGILGKVDNNNSLLKIKQSIFELISNFYQRNSINLNPDEAMSRIFLYVNKIEEKNQVMNLTSFKGEKLWAYGIYESLLCMFEVLEYKSFEKFKLLDIGSGAGFPGVPIKLALPMIDLYIFESSTKKCNFLKGVFNSLKLSAVIENKRVEENTHKGMFDLVTARAVSSLQQLVFISKGLAKSNGEYVWIKGKNYTSEINEAKQILDKMQISLVIKEIQSNLLEYKTYLVTYRGV